ncbi:hypothetical protein SDC9_189181 [bioreactor metagenome]|uniref:Uncharacterized protein n=1 Tax=bioreactor metagenome TaxID=1076179 RepID=A0A645HRR7_9ZZZZ
MVGHAVVVGAHAIADGNPVRLGIGHVDVLVARAHGADQRQPGHALHLRGRQARRANRAHALHAITVGGDCGLGLIGIRRIDHIKVGKGLLHLLQMGGDLEIQN